MSKPSRAVGVERHPDGVDVPALYGGDRWRVHRPVPYSVALDAGEFAAGPVHAEEPRRVPAGVDEPVARHLRLGRRDVGRGVVGGSAGSAPVSHSVPLRGRRQGARWCRCRRTARRSARPPRRCAGKAISCDLRFHIVSVRLGALPLLDCGERRTLRTRHGSLVPFLSRTFTPPRARGEGRSRRANSVASRPLTRSASERILGALPLLPTRSRPREWPGTPKGVPKA